MALIHKIWRVFVYQLRRSVTSTRIVMLFIMVGIYIYSTIQPVADFSAAVGIAAGPWAFPHLVNDYICQLVIMAGVVFLFCDAPFTGESHMYIVSRSGRVAWSGGHALYIIVMSLIYVMFIILSGTLPLLSNLEWGANWGKIWGTLARTDASQQFGLQFTVNDYLIGAFTPAKAMLLSFLLEWACVSWLGLVTYLFNTLTKKMTGTFISAAFILLDIMIANEWTPGAYAFSPITLAQLRAFTGRNLTYGITLNYAVRFFIITILVLIVLCMFSGNIEKYKTVISRRFSNKKRRKENYNG